jgi:hypothetical protein
MNDLDRKIQAALKRESSGDALAGEPNIAEEVLAAFRGRHRWLTTLMAVINVAAFAAMIWAAMRFYDATDVIMQIRWAALAFVLLSVMSMLKLWFWLEMQSNRVLRELKRVELLLVTRPQG